MATAPPLPAVAQHCDNVLITTASDLRDPRAQLGAAQLIPTETFAEFRQQNESLRLMDRQIASFENAEQFEVWRTERSRRYYFEYGLESARASVLAAIQAERPDTLSVWEMCKRQEDDGTSPSLKAWVKSLTTNNATVIARRSGSTDGSLPMIEIISPTGLTTGDGTVSQNSVNGRSVIERIFTVQRQLSGDLQVQVRSNELVSSVVIPQISGGSSEPSRVVRRATGFFIESTQSTSARCVSPEAGMQFDLATLQIVVVRSTGSGRWNLLEKSPNRICVEVAGSVKLDPFKPRISSMAVEVRVMQVGAF